MRFLLLWSLLMLMPNPSLSAGSAEVTVVAFGDSLTAGYGVPRQDSFPVLLEKRLEQAGYRAQVINAGYSGETSSRAVARLDTILAMRPDVVILETGINDFLRGVPPEQIKANLQKIIDVFRDRQIATVLAGFKVEWFSHPGAENFIKIYPELAEKNKLILIPSFLDGIAGKTEFNLADRVHPNSRGYRMITDNIYPYVISAIENIRKNREKS